MYQVYACTCDSVVVIAATLLFTSSLNNIVFRTHPLLVACKTIVDEKRRIYIRLRKNMLKLLAYKIQTLHGLLPPESDVKMRSKLITKGIDNGFETPMRIIQTVSTALSSINELVSEDTFEEKDMKKVIISNSSVLGNLIAIEDPTNKKKSKWFATPWSKRRPQVVNGLRSICTCLEDVTKKESFSLIVAKGACLDLEKSIELCNKLKCQISDELTRKARVMMSTIASSNKFPEFPKTLEVETIVIIDEAGCIPAFELLGLSRLERSIKALICLGDKHQLPPYNPSTVGIRQKSRGKRLATTKSIEQEIYSVLDVSNFEATGCTIGNIDLTKQYRVPRDIADVLNNRIYKGKYLTAATSKVPDRGFHFMHVDSCHVGPKYVNHNEVSKCLELVRQHLAESVIMILTPVRLSLFRILGCFCRVRCSHTLLKPL